LDGVFFPEHSAEAGKKFHRPLPAVLAGAELESDETAGMFSAHAAQPPDRVLPGFESLPQGLSNRARYEVGDLDQQVDQIERALAAEAGGCLEEGSPGRGVDAEAHGIEAEPPVLGRRQHAGQEPRGQTGGEIDDQIRSEPFDPAEEQREFGQRPEPVRFQASEEPGPWQRMHFIDFLQKVGRCGEVLQAGQPDPVPLPLEQGEERPGLDEVPETGQIEDEDFHRRGSTPPPTGKTSCISGGSAISILLLRNWSRFPGRNSWNNARNFRVRR
jgi:hypothetical protein